ncbi:MAG: RNA-binding S4 domain-containing protein [Oscillospiraceae bacterium]
MNNRKIEIKEDYIKLHNLLKFEALVDSGANAKKVIVEKLVYVNNEICIIKGKKIVKGDIVKFLEYTIEVI